MNLANLYRPVRFEDVYGQSHPVRFLSGLIKHGQRGRNLLLHGSVGSGKTSLVRLYERALNCESPTDTGSPCWACRSCLTEDRRDIGLQEYDVSGKGGEIDQVVPWVEAHHRSPNGHNYTVLFFDEAHSLTVKASDALLKSVEEPRKNVIFCFATTEFGRLRPALVSRLHPLEVRPLSPPISIKFLKTFAREVDVTFDPEALSMLAAVGRGLPRDLLTGLEVLAGLGVAHITLQDVKDVFDIDHTDRLVDYFLALGDGNLGLQSDLMFGWQDPPSEKVQWVQAFLASIYHNDLLGLSITVDPFISLIPKASRQDIVRRFCSRLGLESAEQLSPRWRRMMAFWPVAPEALDDAAIALRFTLFHDLVNNDLLATAEMPSPHVAKPIVGQLSAAPDRPHGKPQAQEHSAKAEVAATSDPAYVGPNDVRDIINAASYLTQEHGVLFNAAIEVRPDLFGCDDEESAVAFVVDFCSDLERRASQGTEGPFAWMTLFERDFLGLTTGLVLASIPRPRSRSVRDFLSEAPGWCREYKRELRQDPKDQAIAFAAAPESAAGRVKFHWRHTLKLCAGLGDGELEGDRGRGEKLPLLDLLAIPPTKRRQPGPINIRPFNGRLLGVSKLLSNEAIESATRNRMRFLSAFDDRAWTWITRGWELDEYLDRLEAKKDREDQVAVVFEQQDDVEGRLEALKRLEEEWPDNPHIRERRWSGWWKEVYGTRDSRR